MIDHAPRIRAEQLARQDEAYIADLERRSAPLQWAMIIAVLIVALSGLAGFLGSYRELDLANEKLVACMGGKIVNVGGDFISCNGHTSQLVAGVQP